MGVKGFGLTGRNSTGLCHIYFLGECVDVIGNESLKTRLDPKFSWATNFAWLEIPFTFDGPNSEEPKAPRSPRPKLKLILDVIVIAVMPITLMLRVITVMRMTLTRSILELRLCLMRRMPSPGEPFWVLLKPKELLSPRCIKTLL